MVVRQRPRPEADSAPEIEQTGTSLPVMALTVRSCLNFVKHERDALRVGRRLSVTRTEAGIHPGEVSVGSVTAF